MNTKATYYIAAIIGGIVGSYIPALWGGAGFLSTSSLIFSTLGALIGIFLVWKFLNS